MIRRTLNPFKLNIVVLGILSAIMWRYTVTDKMYYLYLLILTIFLTLKLFKNADLKITNNNLHFMVLALLSMVYVLVFSGGNFGFFLKKHAIVFLLIFYLYYSFMQYGMKYAEKFYKQLTIMLNIFSVLNLYQVIYRKPLLLNYMDLLEVGYNYHFGTAAYRTMSVFNHPIICGLFFVIAFFCNMYVLKSPIRYPLQILLLINIYSTYARSAWVVFVIVFGMYLMMNSKEILVSFKRPRFTYKNVYFSSVFVVLGVMFISFNFSTIYYGIVERIGDSLSFSSTDGSNLQRTLTISLIWNYMFENNVLNLFFGYGVGTVGDFMLKHPVLIQNFATTDNQYLSWFYEFGLIGISTYLFVVIFIFYKYFRTRKNWVTDLSLVCFIIISLELVFFDAIGWPIVYIMLVFVVSFLTFSFKKIHA